MMTFPSRRKKPCMERCCVKVDANRHYLFGLTAVIALGVAITSGVLAKHWRHANTAVRVVAMALAFLGCVLAIRPSWCGPEFNPQRLLAPGFALTSIAIIMDGAFYPVVHCDDVEFRHFKSDTPTWHPKAGGYAEDVHACYDPNPAVAVLCYLELFALLCQICSFCALQKAADLGEAAHAGDADSLASTDDEYHHDTPGNPYEYARLHGGGLPPIAAGTTPPSAR